MRYAVLILTSCLSLTAGMAARAADPAAPLPDAKTVLARYVQALGGVAAIARHASRITVAEFSTTAHPGAVYRSVSYDKPFKSASVTTAPDGREFRSGYDGKVSWNYSAADGLSFDAGDALLSVRRDADMYYATHVQDYFKSLQDVGIETFAGKRCYHLQGVTAWNTPNNQFYDVETGLLVGYHFDSAWRGGPGDTVFVISDYKEFDGTLAPTRFVTTDPKATGTQTILSVDYAPIDDAVFAPPSVFKPDDHPVPCPADAHPKNGCIAVTTAGVMTSTQGAAHYTGQGHYCPKTDIAQYRYTLDAADAKRYGMPLHGIIDYDGPKGTETYLVSISPE